MAAARSHRHSSFLGTLRTATRNAWKNGAISRFDMMRINIAARIRPEIIEEFQSAIIDLAIDAGLMQGPEDINDASFDWNAFLEFMEKFIPMLLQIIAIFG